MDLGMRDRGYIVVGGTRGMGFEAARLIAAEGGRVAVIGRDAGQAQHAAEAIGTQAAGFAADTADDGAVRAAIADAVRRIGPIRGLLATPGSTERNGDLLSMRDEDWQANMDGVLMSVVRPCRAILPHLIGNGGGQIVVTSAYSARAAKPFLFGYAALKAALVNLTKNLAKTYGPQGVRTNCVCPGAVETGKVAAAVDAVMQETGLARPEAGRVLMEERWRMSVGLRRLGRPEELGEVMTFLLSERAAYLNGAIVNADGGTDF